MGCTSSKTHQLDEIPPEKGIPVTNTAVNGNLDDNWFHENVSREDAENFLGAPSISRGTFLVRNSEHSSGPFVISVCDINEQGHREVKHHYIKYGGPRINFYIFQDQSFKTLDELIHHYSNNPIGLSCQLTHPYSEKASRKYVKVLPTIN
jgi:hypothetical protein